MTVPRLHVTQDAPLSTSAPVLVVGVIKGKDGPQLAARSDLESLGSSLDSATLSSIGVAGTIDELVRLPGASGSPSLALIGLGSGVPSPDTLRYAAGAAVRQLGGIAELAIALPADDAAATLAILEGAAIGAYQYLEYRQASREGVKLTAQEITVHGAGDDTLAERATAVATAIHTVRDLVAMPPSDLYPESFAAKTVELAAELPVELEILDEAALEAGGFGGILGVGVGSVRGPRLVVARYSPEGATAHVALVGKGITFDSGGLSLKPAASMVGMKYDMTGAATVLSVVLAAARLKLPIRITAWLCLAENMPSGSAARPNDVLRIRGGKTVEVLNTDAEGRLVLADGIVAASEEHPDAIIDVATLTGAARVAIGERTIPVMGDSPLVRKVIDAGSAVGEIFWHMPLPAELRGVLDSDLADIANAKPGHAAGGMLVAAHFLKYFVGRTSDAPDAESIPWAHLDIAGSANNGGRPYGFTTKGSTGVAVRSLISLVETFEA